jgi:hypothetical protein
MSISDIAPSDYTKISLDTEVIACDLTIAQITYELRRRSNFWIRTNAREVICVSSVTPPKGPPPNTYTTADGTSYRLKKGVLVNKAIHPSTHDDDYWDWVQPPEFTGIPHEDPFAGRRLFQTTEFDFPLAKKAGARWSPIQKSLWVDENDEKVIERLTKLGVFEPKKLVHFIVPYTNRYDASRRKARFIEESKTWALDPRSTIAIAELEALGFERVTSPSTKTAQAQ